jgi:quinol monooxygenase YgiN
MFSYLWEFTVRPDRLEEFLAAYGPGGDWELLFGRDPAFLRTELLRDCSNPQRFVTVDRWTSRAACLGFRERFREELAAVDERCAQLTTEERHLGDFES